MYDSGFTDLKNHFYDRWVVVNQLEIDGKWKLTCTFFYRKLNFYDRLKQLVCPDCAYSDLFADLIHITCVCFFSTILLSAR